MNRTENPPAVQSGPAGTAPKNAGQSARPSRLLRAQAWFDSLSPGEQITLWESLEATVAAAREVH